MNFTPTSEPVTIPKMAAELINVLNKTASESVHANLALITGAVWLFPEIAKPVWILPNPMTKVKMQSCMMLASWGFWSLLLAAPSLSLESTSSLMSTFSASTPPS